MSPHRASSRPSDGLWPDVAIDGQLERAEREWLHTNGAGAYAMSTLALMHTRRHHGLLVAALEPPLRRHVILSHAETSVTVGDRSYKLATHQFPGVAPTPGYRLLKSFAMDPLPRWTYRLGKATLERTLGLARGVNAVVLRYHWTGRAPARLSLMPLLPMRPVEHLAREHGGMVQRVTLRPGEVEIQPLASLPPIVFGHRGVFMGSPDWWRRFEYSEDLRRYTDYQEDMWTPGTFELVLEPDCSVHLVIAVGSLPLAQPSEILLSASQHQLAQDPGQDRSAVVRTLSVAADAFTCDDCSLPALVAGYPWLGAPLRDWLISLPGLLLSRGRVAEARRSLHAVTAFLRAGLLPVAVPEGGRAWVGSPDATLWLFEAARVFAERVGLHDPFVRAELYPTLIRAFVRLRGRPGRRVWVTEDGALATAASGAAATWMDAQLANNAITPRAGLAVEHQALWFRACRTLGGWARYFGHEHLASACHVAGDRAAAAFAARFWCSETHYPYDCTSAARDSADAWADPSIRPNAVIALSLAPELFEPWQADAVLSHARRELLTPRGLRTLTPDDRAFRGHYEGTFEERETAEHQGTAWPYLLGAYVRACLAQSPDDAELRTDLRALVERACDDAPVLGHVAQIADGEEPHRFRGCPAQAWSAAELLRALVTDLGDG